MKGVDDDFFDIDKLDSAIDTHSIEKSIGSYFGEISSKVNADNRMFEWWFEEGDNSRKNQIKERNIEARIIKCGLIIQSYEGMEAIEELPFYRSSILKDSINEESKAFLELRASQSRKKIEEDAGFQVDDNYIMHLFKERGEFVNKYPNSVFVENITKWDRELIAMWLLGMGNSPVVDWYDTGKVRETLKNALDNFVENYPDYRYSPLFRSYLQFIDSKNLMPKHEDIKSFLEESEELKNLGIDKTIAW